MSKDGVVPKESKSGPAAGIRSIAELLGAAYAEKRKRVKLAKGAADTIQSGPRIETPERDQLLRLASQDRLLDRTRDLLLLSAERIGSHPLGGAVRSFVGDVLRNHPVFVKASLDGVLRNLPDAPSDDTALRQLLSYKAEDLQWPEGAAPLKKKQSEQLRMNAFFCLLLWIYETRGDSLDSVQRSIATAAWEPAARRYRSDPQRLRALMLAKDRAALGVSYAMFEETLQEGRRHMIAAREAEQYALAAEQRALTRVQALEAELETTNGNLREGNEERERLREELASSRRACEDDKAHLRSDHEAFRGRVLSRMKREVTLLDEGLQAIKRDSPKIHVMVDHAERAIDGLKKEMNEIRGGKTS